MGTSSGGMPNTGNVAGLRIGIHDTLTALCWVRVLWGLLMARPKPWVYFFGLQLHPNSTKKDSENYSKSLISFGAWGGNRTRPRSCLSCLSKSLHTVCTFGGQFCFTFIVPSRMKPEIEWRPSTFFHHGFLDCIPFLAKKRRSLLRVRLSLGAGSMAIPPLYAFSDQLVLNLFLRPARPINPVLKRSMVVGIGTGFVKPTSASPDVPLNLSLNEADWITPRSPTGKPILLK